MSEHAAVTVTLLIILSFVLLSGVFLDALWSKLSPGGTPLVSYIYKLADIDIHSYRRCSNPGYFYANWKRSHDKIQFLANWTIGKLMCNIAAWSLMDKALVGSSLLGCGAFGRYILAELLMLIRLRGEAGGEALWKVAMLLTWVFSLGNRALSRLAIVVGTCLSAKEVFLSLIVHGRALSQRIGEQILEPSPLPANGIGVQVLRQ